MIRFFRSLVWGGRLGAALSRAEKMRAAGKRQAAFSVVQKAIFGLDKAGLAEEAPLDASRALLVAIGEALAFELEEPGFSDAELAKALAMIESVNLEAEPDGYARYIPFLRSRIQNRQNRGQSALYLMGDAPEFDRCAGGASVIRNMVTLISFLLAACVASCSLGEARTKNGVRFTFQSMKRYSAHLLGLVLACSGLACNPSTAAPPSVRIDKNGVRFTFWVG